MPITCNPIKSVPAAQPKHVIFSWNLPLRILIETVKQKRIHDGNWMSYWGNATQLVEKMCWHPYSCCQMWPHKNQYGENIRGNETIITIAKVFCSNSIIRHVFGTDGRSESMRTKNTFAATEFVAKLRHEITKRKCVWLSTIEHVFKSKTWCFVVAIIIKFKYVWLRLCIHMYILQVNNAERFSCIHCQPVHMVSPFTLCSLSLTFEEFFFAQITAQQQHSIFIVALNTYLSFNWSSLADGNGWTTKCSEEDDDDIISLHKKLTDSHEKFENFPVISTHCANFADFFLMNFQLIYTV